MDNSIWFKGARITLTGTPPHDIIFHPINSARQSSASVSETGLWLWQWHHSIRPYWKYFSPSFYKHFSTHNLRGETWKEADILQSLWKKTDMVASPPFPTPFLGPERSLWVSNIPAGRGPTWKPLPEKGCERHKQAEKGTWHVQQVLEGTATGTAEPQCFQDQGCYLLPRIAVLQPPFLPRLLQLGSRQLGSPQPSLLLSHRL